MQIRMEQGAAAARSSAAANIEDAQSVDKLASSYKSAAQQIADKQIDADRLRKAMQGLPKNSDEYKKLSGALGEVNRQIAELGKKGQGAYLSPFQQLGDDIAKLQAAQVQIMQYGRVLDQTKEATIQFDIAQGKLKGLSPAQKESLLLMARQADALAATNKFLQEQAKDYDDLEKSIAQASKQADAFIQSMRDSNDQSEFELSIMGKTDLQQRILQAQRKIDIDLQKELNKLRAEGVNLGDKENEMRAAADVAKIKAADLETAKYLKEQWKDVFSSMESVGKQAFVNVFTRDGASSAETLRKTIQTSIIDLLYNMTARKWILSFETLLNGSVAGSTAAGALQNVGSGVINNLSNQISTAWTYDTSLFSQQTSMLAAQTAGFFAKGGAFDRTGQVHAFASGGVVDRPTTFRFANGGSGFNTGLMGEAGPEAILPLRRDSSGRLGVVARNDPSSSASGGGITLVYSPVFKTDARQTTPGTAQALGAVINKASDQALSNLMSNLNSGGAFAVATGRRRAKS